MACGTVSDDFLASEVDEHLESEREEDAEYDEVGHSQHFCTMNQRLLATTLF